MIKKYIWAVLLLMLLSCSEDPLEPVSDGVPEIVSVTLPGRWNLNAGDSTVVEIKATDPQGASDLQSATFQVFNASSGMVFSADLFDDGGISGSTDLIAGDGVFRNLFKPSQITEEGGSFLFTFNVSDKMGNQAEAVSKTVTFALNQAPQILSSSTPAILEDGAAPKVIQVIVRDEDSALKDINVYLDLLFNDISILNEPIMLANDGNISENGDEFAADSIYSLKIDSSFAAGRQGTYKMVFTAKDEFDDQSTVVQNEIMLENSKPLISGLVAEQTISRPSNPGVFNSSLITLDVHDSQSLADIDSVYFISIKPDGTPAQGNPFLMLDNGIAFDINNFETARGDKDAGDGRYSITILVNNENDPGVYEFTFFARDKAGNLSQSILHHIEVD